MNEIYFAAVERYLVQFCLDGVWLTIATCKTLKTACAVAKKEFLAMNRVYETSVIRDGDSECLRRQTCENFELV